jgi:rhamnogalacturonyl hydrolase YesR
MCQHHKAWLFAACLVSLIRIQELAAQPRFAVVGAKRQQAIHRSLISDHAGDTEYQLVKIGVSRNFMPMWAVLPPAMFDLSSRKTRVLIVYDDEPDAESIGNLNGQFRDFFKLYHDPNKGLIGKIGSRVAVGFIPEVLPDRAISLTGKEAAGQRHPPTGTAYGDVACPEREYLWRYIGMLAPDVVIHISRASQTGLVISESPLTNVPLKSVLPKRLPVTKQDSDSLASALSRFSPASVAPVPAIEFRTTQGFLPLALHAINWDVAVQSPARKELLRRQARTPIEVAEELSKVYGHNLNSVAYIPALALIGRCRLGELTGDKSHLADVEKIVAPYFSGEKPTMGKRVGGSNLSGHLVFGELAARTKKRKYLELAGLAAELGIDDDGEMKEAMPFHSEMSDAVFMGTPILVQCGRLTGNQQLFDMAARHLEFMLKLNLREDGLHQHSPLDPEHTAWGRGNGFPALGLALCLTDLPKENEHRPRFLEVYRNHMAAMKKHQDEMGMWHQVVDHQESYREFTVTCMTTFAMTRGLRNGWLDRETYEPVVVRAWEAIKTRIGNDGILVDVCTGTGKQKSFRDYLDRTAILGRDDRGGAMALMVSTEIAFAEREKAIKLTR